MHGGLNSSWFIKHGWWSSKIWRMWSCGMEWPKENREILPITSTNFQQNHQQLQLKTPPELEKQVESLNFRIILGDFPRTSPTRSHVEFTNKKRQVLNLSISEATFLTRLTQLAEAATVVLTVCTGSLLLAATQLLNGVKATTNKVRCVMAGEGSWGLSFFAPNIQISFKSLACCEINGCFVSLVCAFKSCCELVSDTTTWCVNGKKPQYSHELSHRYTQIA